MRLKLLSILLFLFSVPLIAQSWVSQNSGITSNLNDVFCITADIVVVVGDGGVILKTTDGGAHWTTKASGTTQFLRKVQFISNTTGFAAGQGGIVLKTTDTGENWNPIASGTTNDLYGLSVLDENTFYISGANGLIKKTNDGGATFTDQSYGQNHFFSNIQLLDANTAFASSYDYYGADTNVFIKTVDGGENWVPFLDQNTAYFYFLDQNTGFISDSLGNHQTTDGGLTLTDLMATTDNKINDMFATNPNVLWSVGTNAMLCNCSYFCIHRSDSSIPSTPDDVQNCYADTNGALPFEAIHFANETTGYIVGWGGTILKNSTGEMEPLAVDQFAEDDFAKVYPNPSSDMVYITFKQTDNTPFNVQITDVTGKIALAQSSQSQADTAINIESLSKGVYFLKMQSDNRSIVKKLVRQ